MSFDDDIHPPRRRGIRLAMIVILLVVAGGIAAVVYHSKNAAKDAPGGAGGGGAGGPGGGKHGMNGPTSVSTATVKAGDIHIVLDALGAVTPLATVTVRTQISGTLTDLAYTEGQLVKQGAYLAEVDPRPYQLTLQQDEGQFEKDQALLAQAQKDLARYQLLVSQDSVARQTLDNEVSLVEQYKGAIQVDQAQIKTAQLNIQYCRILAPVSGRLGLRQVDAGNYVQTSDTNGIVVITQMDPMSVIFTVPEDNVDAIGARVASGAQLPVTALDRSQSVVLAQGMLMTIDNQIDPSTGTVKLRAVFDNKNGALFPSQFVNVHLLVNTLSGVLVIPSSAVQRGQPGTYVYIVKPDDTVGIQPITLGPAEGETVSVTKGLTAGQIVVSDGADKLKDGAKVLLPNAAPAAPAAANDTPGTAATPDQQAGHKGNHHRHADQAQPSQ